MALEVYHVPSYKGSIENDSSILKVVLAQFAANQDNLVTGAYDIVEISSDAARNLTGIVAPSAAAVRILYNRGSYTITLKHNATSTAANRFTCPGAADFSLTAGAWVPMLYDTVSARWIVSTEVPRSGFKLAVNKAANCGVYVMLDRRWWNVKHLALEADGTTVVSVAVWARKGVAIPTADYAGNSAATRQSRPILPSEEILEQLKPGEAGVWLLAGAVATDCAVRFLPNEVGGGLNR